MMNLFAEEKIIQVLAAQYSQPATDRAAALKLIVNNLIPDFSFFEGLTDTSTSEWVAFFDEPSAVKVSDLDGRLDCLPAVLWRLYEQRHDLQTAFDLSQPGDALRFLGWFFTYGAHETELKAFSYFDCKLSQLVVDQSGRVTSSFKKCIASLFPKATDQEIEQRARACLAFRTSVQKYTESRTDFREKWSNPSDGGVNLVGYFSGSKGIAEDARLTAEAFERLSIPIHKLEIRELSRLELAVRPYSKTIFCVPADVAFLLMQKLGAEAIGKQTIYCSSPWELPIWPQELECVLETSKSVFVHSQFVLDSIPNQLKAKAALMPLPVTLQSAAKNVRKEFGIATNSIAFFSSFDFASYFQRKNPTAVVEAFLEAFPLHKEDAVCLILKSTRANSFPSEYAQLAELIKTDSRIKIIDEDLDRSELINLYGSCDVFVSLHRSEGFGRNIAEAMKLEKLVITTAYSGNMTFTDERNALLVPYRLVPLKKNDYIFARGESWAEPDIHAAAKLMQKAMELKKSGAAKQICEAAAIEINARFSIEKLCEFLSVRFKNESQNF